MKTTQEKILPQSNQKSDFIVNRSETEERIKWFKYWEMSKEQWRSFFENSSSQDYIFIPINWRFHFTSKSELDFQSGNKNLDLIEKLAREFHRDIIFTIPLTPYVFDNFGGFPEHLFQPSYDQNSLPRVIMNHKNEIFKMPSIYGEQTYKEYCFFLKKLSESFSKRRSKTQVKGLISGYLEDDKFIDFFEDSSPTFLKAFERYLSNISIDDIHNEDVDEFRNMVRNLFFESTEKILRNYWGGSMKIVFHGSKPSDIVYRSQYQDRMDCEYFSEVEQCIRFNFLSSKVLLNPKAVHRNFNKVFLEMMNFSYIESVIHSDYGLSANLKYQPLSLVNINFRDEAWFRRSNIKSSFDDILKKQYTFSKNNQLSSLDSEDDQIHFFFAHQLSNKEFKFLLSLKNNLNTFILDLAGMTDIQKSIFSDFKNSDSSHIQKVEKLDEIEIINFHQKKIIAINNKVIKSLDKKRQLLYWKNIFSLSGVYPSEIMKDFGISNVSMTREVSPFELSYNEVRRHYFYNFSNKSRKFHIPSSKNLVFVKYLESKECELQSTPIGIDVEMKSGGSIILDYGLIKDGHEKRNDSSI